MITLEKQNNKRIFGLDLIRSLAILLVLFSHLFYLINNTNPLLLSISGVAGFVGVEIFFVLSGFLIGNILLRQYITESFSLTNVFVFLKRRWLRTLPNYYLILLLNIIIAYFLNYSFVGWYKYFFFIQNFYSYFITFFSESWSLSVAEWTYILLPFSLLFAFKLIKQFSKKFTFVVAIILLIILAHIFRYFNMINSEITTMEVWNVDLKSIVIYRFDTILYGVLLAWLYNFYRVFLIKYKIYFLIIAAHLFLLQFLILNALGVDIITCPVYFKVFYFTLSASIYVLSMPFFIFWKSSKSIFSGAVGFVSRTSYGAYLLHYSVIAVLLKYYLYYFSYQFSTILIIVIYFAITFFLSYILYRFFEKPIMDLRDKN